jgi:hypothetical protein
MFSAAQTKNPWRNLYTKERENGQKISVAVPPSGDAVLIRVDGRTVGIKWSEVRHVADALLAALDPTGAA